jgi:hypothetical protein
VLPDKVQRQWRPGVPVSGAPSAHSVSRYLVRLRYLTRTDQVRIAATAAGLHDRTPRVWTVGTRTIARTAGPS